MKNKSPRRGTNIGNEQAKDFKSAIIRLFKELKGFKFLIILSLILAMLGSILSIVAPNKLSELTPNRSKRFLNSEAPLFVSKPLELKLSPKP